MEYGKIISKALRITWQEKTLWLFASLTVLPTILLGFVSPFRSSFEQFNNRTKISPEDIAVLIPPLLTIICFSILIAFLLTPISIAGVIRGVHLTNTRKKYSIKKLFLESLRYYWRLFIIPFIVGFVALIAAILMAIIFSVLGQSENNIALTCLLPLICIGFLGILFLSVVIIFTYISVVVENIGVGEAFSNSWTLIRQNFWAIVGALIIFGTIGLVIGIAFNWIYTNIWHAVTGISFNGSFNGPIPIQNDPIRNTLLYLFTLINYLVTAILSVFTYSLWTLAYTDLRTSAEQGKKIEAYLKSK
jgi:hypothetical protein